MMIHVQVTPTQPIALRHRPEEWMASPTKVPLPSKPINQRFQLADVGGKFCWLRAASLLIVFRSGRDAMRPADRQVSATHLIRLGPRILLTEVTGRSPMTALNESFR